MVSSLIQAFVGIIKITFDSKVMPMIRGGSVNFVMYQASDYVIYFYQAIGYTRPMNCGMYENYKYKANDVYCSCYENVIIYVSSIRPIIVTFTGKLDSYFFI